MEINSENINEIYEVEKIINFRYYKNKKYYLIKWLSYPISESTWEPKINLKYINDMLIKFEKEYPYSIDQNMYNIYCDEINKRKKISKTGKKNKRLNNGIKYLSKTKKIEGFTKTELKDTLYEKLKNHLFIVNRHIDKIENEVVIDLSTCNTSPSDENISISINKNENQVIIDLSTCNTSFSEENTSIYFNGKENLDTEEKNDGNKLIKPIIV